MAVLLDDKLLFIFFILLLLSCSYYYWACFSQVTRVVISKLKGRHDTFYLATFISLANSPYLTHAVTVATMRYWIVVFAALRTSPRTQQKWLSRQQQHTKYGMKDGTTLIHTECSAKRVSDFRMLDESFWVKNARSLCSHCHEHFSIRIWLKLKISQHICSVTLYNMDRNLHVR